jgi:hypothetical protein
MVRRLLRRLAYAHWLHGDRGGSQRQIAADRDGEALPLHAARRLRDLDQVTRLGEW